MYVCSKCKQDLYIVEHAIIEEINHSLPYCEVDTMKRYYVAIIFRCDNCKVDYGWKAVSKFTEYPVVEE